jgi:hypothetical protein
VSCPDAAGTGVIGAAGAAEVAGAADEGAAEVGVWYGVPLAEHPVTATTATAVRPTTTLETEDTALSNPNQEIDTSQGTGPRPRPARGARRPDVDNDAGTPTFAPTAASDRGKGNIALCHSESRS